MIRGGKSEKKFIFIGFNYPYSVVYFQYLSIESPKGWSNWKWWNIYNILDFNLFPTNIGINISSVVYHVERP